MKKILFVLAASYGAIFMNSCEEIGPAIDFTKPVEGEYDTSYVLDAVPAADSKKVFVEEYTGVECPNCPDGTKKLKDYEDAHPGTVIVSALHQGFLTEPLAESTHDFRNDDILGLINYMNGDNSPKPAAAIDRVKQNNTYFTIDRSQWSNYIDQRVAVPSPVNISVTSKYDTTNRKVVVKVRLVYTSPVTTKQNLSVFIVEDNIVDAQLNVTTHVLNYVHNNVFRDFVTPVITGAGILNSLNTKPAGQVYERQFVHTPKYIAKPGEAEPWNLDNCRVIAVVSNDEQTDKSVVQVADVHLK